MRQIDWSKPLSDEDRAWAEQRLDMLVDGVPMHQKIAENDLENGKAEKDASQSRQQRIEELRGIIADSENELSRLQVEQQHEDSQNVAFGGTEDDRRRGLGVVDNTAVDGETPDGAPTAKEDYSDEQYWSKAKLTEEIENRNREREAEGLKPLAKTGNRSELVERLLKDDEELENS
jgi:hypothetical protein